MEAQENTALHRDPFLLEMEMKVDPSMVTVQGRVLPPPSIEVNLAEGVEQPVLKL